MRLRKDLADAAEHGTMDQDPVVQGILKAISLKRLRPGMKLGEIELASAFGTNRMHIRQVLSHLGSRNLVTHIPNRGAFVSQPSADEARAIFDARKTLESAAITRTIENMNKKTAQELQQLVDAEQSHSHGDRWDGLNFSAGFHVEIARLSGNPVLAKFMEELALRTSLIIAQFEPPGAEDHCPSAHPRIAEKILARDKAGAIRAMEDHLNEMQARLQLEGTEGEDGIATIFQSLGIVPASKRKSTQGKA